MSILDSIKGHDDVRALPLEDLPKLADAIRDRIVEVMPINGGHFGAGLGITDLTLALHRVFDFRVDHFVLDVSHQCYPHKMLSGRADWYREIRLKDGPAGYTRPTESDYDRFMWAHAGTSISTALGLARGEHDGESWAVAIIGDASIPTGVAMEALNHWGVLNDERLLVILNDNDMAIAPSVGGLSKHLKEIKARHREHGEVADGTGRNAHLGRFFEAQGNRYVGPVDGHDIFGLVELFEKIKAGGKSTLVHAMTVKGKGHREAEKDQWKWHAVGGAKKPGLKLEYSRFGSTPYTNVFVDALMELAREDDDIHAINAAMPCGTGLRKFEAEFPERCYDVGIAEQHAVAFAAGLAKAGKKPVAAIYSTFLQRAFDQIFQEMSLNNLPVVLCLDRAGIVGPDGATHNGCFDIAYIRAVPRINIMAPRDGSELKDMLALALASGEPCAIRYPRTAAPDPEKELPRTAELVMGRSEVLRQGRHAAIIAYGSMVYPAIDVAEMLEKDGIEVTLVNARFVRPIDEDMLREVLGAHPIVFTLEEHTLNGGFGSACLEAAARNRLDAGRLHPIGIPDDFVEHAQRSECLEMVELDPESLVRRMKEAISQNKTGSVRATREAEAF